MHKHILNKNQLALLPLVKEFSSQFGLVGGTAIALQLGHRRSIDFDLFIQKPFSNDRVRDVIKKHYSIDHTFVEGKTELTVLVNKVQFTFYRYNFPIKYTKKFDDIVGMPSLETLAAMKAFALGKRTKWKDYVDLYFILQNISFKSIADKAREIFTQEFNEKLFRSQLSYFKDLDLSEGIDYLPGFEKSDEEIQSFLEAKSVEL
ncbi:MAG: hypothetical protein COZ34_05260 [Candidatus Pacebacteria bacterium CG_4_10_14_3_um_filter_34_15]|nr:nucleotidyl transferase AbiEii/AbiGii toxin family protein [Candidatus Pacearchaeota archaeon]NCQ65751.1 nucleotidyl transferase AbiEii/AbiGii toxin family protein [Candidatus Paceibacterota bacterium]OIO44160.1 MAG: hypothetical protein AUJ41_03830 [Candidatus Pacebacteria bacterium CG1_02_43_31]PIQ80847.1 MAG: hypothetical protein COV78_03450 [Candidatus Pacebacteria bacterium CG11_big_fil_rev_8_21_14_0_20_34_55]PIX81038.1 MAG: hypothetical protein COZ34_05260 [Candidatus Pacebacteria bact